MPAIDQYVSTSEHDIAANTASVTKYYGQCLPGTWQIKRVQITPSTSVAIDATDYLDFAIKKVSTTIASLTTLTGGTALTAGTPVALTISGSGTTLEFAQGDAYNLVIDCAPGAGKAFNARVEVFWERVAR